MQRFPTIESLAEASQDEVIKEWEGLGYYSRARNLHEGAKQVVTRFGGKLPKDASLLKEIKGLGPYTIGAIRSFAFHEKAAALDGNVIRVLTRYFGIEEDIAKPKTVRELWKIAEEILPDETPWLVSEALIELGATVCFRPAKCGECPLRKDCKAFQTGIVEALPFKSKKIKIETLYRAVAVLQCGDSLLVRRGEKGKVMSDLHEFPYFPIEQGEAGAIALQKKLQEEWDLSPSQSLSLPEVTHTFTRFKAHLSPIYFAVDKAPEIPGHHWKSFSELQELAFSSGHRKILQEILERKGD